MDTAVFPYLSLIPGLPLLGAAILTFFGARMERSLVNTVALGSVLGAFIITAISSWTMLSGGTPIEAHLWSWMAVGRYSFDLRFGLDQLSCALLLVVTGVGFLIHVYSTEYMEEDPAHWRFFAYLNFFIFAMSVLVLGRSLPVMFIGWEGVGLASYLLIGFWYSDAEKASAGKKAFITNRVGDFGFLIGTFTLIGLFGTADFYELKESAAAIRSVETVISQGMFAGYTIKGVLTFACLSLFVGACGKSAQFPLYVWLPDAMAGPTPVSALIHAATMVTSGVYMVCRLGFLFDLAPAAGDVVAITGAITALFAASIGLAQWDIKKVLAYSTVSQLGYMFVAAGLGAYGAAMFHVVTHAFFKACLFLGSGAVIHALHGEQDMRRMGALKKELPVVYWTFLVSTLALSGIAPLSGFFSKDMILAYAFQEMKPLWVVGFLAAGMTALYMMRLVALTFYGNFRFKDHRGQPGHVHVPHWGMRGPLVILALLAVVAGAANLPHVIAHDKADWFNHFLAPVTGELKLSLSHGTEIGLMAGSFLWAAAGLLVGYVIFKNGPSEKMAALTKGGPGRVAHTLLYGKWFIDEIIKATIIAPLRFLSSVMAIFVDPWIIDFALVKLPSYVVRFSGRLLTRFQTGNVQSYAVVMVVGVAVIVLWAM